MMEGLKGVMLCQRPVDSGNDRLGDTLPFRPSSITAALEQVGITPSKKVVPLTKVMKKRPTALDKHRKLVYTLAKECKQKEAAKEELSQKDSQKKQRVAEFGQQLRAAILSNQDTTGFWAASMSAAALSELQQTNRSAMASIAATLPKVYDTQLPLATLRNTAGKELLADDEKARICSEMAEFVDSAVIEAAALKQQSARPLQPTTDTVKSVVEMSSTAQEAGAAAQDGASSSTKAQVDKKMKGHKVPAWALTEEKLEQRAEAEEEQLLKFTEELDFDRFLEQLDDTGLQDALRACEKADDSEGHSGDEGQWKRTFVRAMNHMANRQAQTLAMGRVMLGDAAEGSVCGGCDDDAGSTISRGTVSQRAKSEAAAQKRAALAARQDADDWDASTRADDDDVGRMEVTSRTLQAESILRENPELQGVHSVASVRAMLQRAEGQLVAAS